MQIVLPLTLAALLLAGCASPNALEGSADAADGNQPPAWAFPALEDATIRPGAAIESNGGFTNAVAQGDNCTGNFVFLDAANTTVYLGTAAHCLMPGATYQIEGAAHPATVAYDARATMDAIDEEDVVVRLVNDFALLELHPDDARKAHPAMLAWGGPEALGNSSGFAVGDAVQSYGATPLRPGPESLDAREGTVERVKPWYSVLALEGGPGLPGDSGSGVLVEGVAAGVLIHLHTADLPGAHAGPTGTNKMVHLDRALGYAAKHAGVDVRLATAPLEA